MKSKFYLLALAALLVVYFSGCKKDSVKPPVTDLSKAGTSNEQMILTPGGLMPKSHVFLIEPGYHLSVNNGQVLKVRDITNETVAVLSKADQSVNPSSQGPGLFNQNNKAHLPGQAPSAPYPSAWQAYTYWHGSSTGNITSFSTSWTIPPAPTTNTGNHQLIYIFEGTSNDNQTDITQPVLQWGNNGAFGSTSSWTIANWYLWNNNAYAAYSTAIVGISAGTSLTGVISYNGTASSGYSYTSSFTGHSTSNMTVSIGNVYNNLSGGTITLPAISYQTWAYEALESYHWTGTTWASDVSNITDYPTTMDVRLTNISLSVNGATPSPFTWTGGSGSSIYGENPVVMTNNVSGSGEVDLYYSTDHSYTFGVETTYPTASYFNMTVNGASFAASRGTATQYSINNITNTDAKTVANSTIVMQITAGHIPTSAYVTGPFGTVYATISGSNVTFSGVDLSIGNSCGLVIN